MPPKKIHTKEFIENEAKELLKWFESAKNNILLMEFAISRGYPSDYFRKWKNISKVFNTALARAKEYQKVRLINRGLTDRTATRMCEFTLAALGGDEFKKYQDVTLGGNLTLKISVKKRYEGGESQGNTADSKAGETAKET